jgi:FemAB-related protein (PEP-CTERM system-associated)
MVPTALAAAAPLDGRRITTVVVAGDADGPDWDRFVDGRGWIASYHAWAWRAVFTRAFGHQPIYLIARDETGVVGVLPLVFIKSMLFGRSLTSLPFVNYGGVIADSSEVRDALADAAGREARARSCGHVELRHVTRQFSGLPCKHHKVTMLLPLHDVAWDRLDRKVRNQIRKAQKSALSSEFGGAELLPDFYSVFARNMRDLGTPVYSRRFFTEVFAALPPRVAVHVVRLHGRPIAAAITYRCGDTVQVPWASSIRDYNSLCPNHLLYWSAIERARAEGAGRFDFGRSTPNEGTYKFKEQWGALPVQLSWEYQLLEGDALPNTSPTNSKFQMAIRMWQKLPLGVATRLGPHIVRAIP